MNREIKFKVYANNKLFGYERLVNGSWEWMCIELNPDKGERWVKGVFTNGTPLVRTEFTRLKDKNGKETYEGDIVEYGLPFHGKITTILKGKIVYNEYCGAFQIAYKNIHNGFVTDFAHKFKIIEVIGNIYETPDLLNK